MELSPFLSRHLSDFSMKAISLTLFCSLILCTHGCSKTTKHHEKYYQKIACNQLDGVIEYTLKNRTRVDCLTDEYAIEVDFAHKGYEAIGQSLYYALETKKQAGIILIRKKRKDDKYIGITKKVAKKYDIKLWVIAEKNGDIKLVEIL